MLGVFQVPHTIEKYLETSLVGNYRLVLLDKKLFYHDTNSQGLSDSLLRFYSYFRSIINC